MSEHLVTQQRDTAPNEGKAAPTTESSRRATTVIDLRDEGGGGPAYREPSVAHSEAEQFYAEPDPVPAGRGGVGGAVGAWAGLVASAFVIVALTAQRSVDSAASPAAALLAGILRTDNHTGLAAWWTSALFVLAAVWSWAAAQRARAGRRWVRWLTWNLMALVLMVASACEAFGLPDALTRTDWIRSLSWVSGKPVPGVVLDHPVTFVLALALAIPGLVLTAGGRAGTKVALFFAAAAGGLAAAVGLDWVEVSTLTQTQDLTRFGFAWFGLFLVMAAAGSERP